VLDDVKLGALVALVAVALGICVAYLTLDRLRHRTVLEKHLHKLKKHVNPLGELLARVDNLTLIEMWYIKCQYYCKDDTTYDQISKVKMPKKKGGMDSNLEICLKLIAFWQFDRWVIKLISFLLYMVLFFLTWTILHGNKCGNFINTEIAQNALLVLVLASYIVPALASWLGGVMINMCRDAISEQVDDAIERQQRGAQEAAIPNVGQ
jgi:hypothetical protein